MPSPNRLTKLALWILFIIGVILLSAKIYTGPLREAGPFQNFTFPDFNFSSTFIYSFESEKLSGIVRRNLTGVEGNFSVYIEDLTDNDRYELHSGDSFPAASLYKLYLIAVILKEVEQGSLKLDNKLTATKAYLTEILGEVDFGYEEAPETIVYSVDEALTRVGRISDNFAAIMLVERVGWEKVQDMAGGLGATNTSFKVPFTTSAKDIGLYFKRLYQKTIVSENVSNKIIEYLSLNQLSDRLPAKLPKDDQNQPVGWQMVHKTGELAGVRHDAGLIIFPKPPQTASPAKRGEQPEQPQRAYIIVLLSKDLKYEDEGVEVLANISKDVYEYFSSKGQ